MQGSGFAGRTNYAQSLGVSSLVGDTTNSAMFRAQTPVRLSEVTDGLSNTAMYSEIRRGLQVGLANNVNYSAGVTPGSLEDLASPVMVSVTLSFPLPTVPVPKLGDYYDPAQCNLSLTTQNREKGRGNRYFQGSPLATFYNHTLTPNSRMRDCISLLQGEGHLAARSYHSGGVNVLLGDGSVRFAKDSTDPAVWRAVGTRASGDVIGDW